MLVLDISTKIRGHNADDPGVSTCRIFGWWFSFAIHGLKIGAPLYDGVVVFDGL